MIDHLAEALRPALRQALDDLQRALAGPEPFDSATAKRTFRVSTTEYGQLVLLPGLLARLSVEAPGVDLWVAAMGGGDVDSRLADGDLDLGIGPARTSAGLADLQTSKLLDERFVVVVRRDHPTVGDTLAGPDLVVTLAARVAHAFAERLPLRVLEPPLDLPGFPGHAWLRGVLAATAAELGSSRLWDVAGQDQTTTRSTPAAAGPHPRR